MFPSNTLLSLIFIALSAVDATPLSRRSGKATLSFTTKINGRGTLSMADVGRARAQVMKQAGQLGKRDGSIPITNAQISYTAQVGVGAGTYTLLIDTGSANTFVGANQPYAPSSASQDTGYTASVNYGSGSWSGEEFTDTVSLGSDLVINQQSFGVASTSTGLSGVDGILGVGPVDLTVGTVSDGAAVPTVMDNLFSQGAISQEVLGVYFIPIGDSDSGSAGAGELSFGTYDSSLITGSVAYVPLTTTSPASTYWGIDASITYGTTSILSLTAGIVDTGTSLILIATDAFQKYQAATGGVPDSATTLLSITSDQYSALQSLWFGVGSNSYELTPNGQIWPRAINTAIGGSSTSIYLIVSDIGTNSGSGLDFMLGYTFLERYYSIYDTTNQQVGFAATTHTTSTSN